MPDRILRERICTSENLNLLSPEAEVFFYRLITQADDFGRMDARPAILRSRCFPLRESEIIDKITLWLGELEAAELVKTYYAQGRRFVYFVSWDKHQHRRARVSKYPDPHQPPEFANTCLQMQTDVSKCQQTLANVSEESRNRGIEESRNRGGEETRENRAAPAAPPTPTEPKIPKTPEKPGSSRDKTNHLYPVMLTLAKVCVMDLQANFGEIRKVAADLERATPPITPELIQQHYNGSPGSYWRTKHWLGQKGEHPTPAEIRRTWGKWDTANTGKPGGKKPTADPNIQKMLKQTQQED